MEHSVNSLKTKKKKNLFQRMKIIDILETNRLSYSFEFFPPKDDESKNELYKSIDYLQKKFNPVFIDITWGAGGRTADKSVEITDFAQNELKLETQMHLTCVDIDSEKIKKTLDTCKEKNISNILALRGDVPCGKDYLLNENFRYSKDLVRYIRAEYYDFFGICVAGYPEGHTNYQQDLHYLKEKMDAGADFVITQLFFDVDFYLRYKKDVHDMGITCPIVPGILPIINYHNFKRMQQLCNIEVPEWILEKLEEIKNDRDKIIDFGIQVASQMCIQLYDMGVKSFHFYTLNKTFSVEQIILQLENHALSRLV